MQKRNLIAGIVIAAAICGLNIFLYYYLNENFAIHLRLWHILLLFFILAGIPIYEYTRQKKKADRSRRQN